MPEYPDVTVYVEALEARVVGQPIEKLRIAHPFLLRSATPPIRDAEGRTVTGVSRMGKRIVFALDGDLHLVLHLMIAGRLRWRERAAKIPARLGLAAFDFPDGTLLLTEAGTKRRASLHLIAGREALDAIDRGGLEWLESDLARFSAALTGENHTLKRSLTDPRLFSGVGNAYSDEILHRARLSPVKLTRSLSPAEIERLFVAGKLVLTEWTDRLRREVAGGFPEKVTAFHAEMAVHGRFGKPCPDCGTPVQRIRYAENETNYCPHCQTGDRLLADRALSRLLKSDWPRSLEEMEERKEAFRAGPLPED